MAAKNNKFRVDVFDSAGTKLGAGFIPSVDRVTFTKRLDRIGEASFQFPAADPKVALIEPGTQYDIYDDDLGLIGRYLYKSDSIQDRLGQAVCVVETWDTLKELSRLVVGFGRDYAAEAIEDIVDELVTDVTDWTTDIGTGLGTANISYQGNSVLDAVQDIAKRWGYHFRLGDSARELQFGAFGTVNTAVRLMKARGQSTEADNVTNVAYVTRIVVTTYEDDLWNRIIALGAGEGTGQITLEDGAVGGTYTVDSRTPTGSQPMTYIEDTTSSTAYGVRETVVIFDDIKPVANTATAKQQARDELLTNAEEWLLRHKDPRVKYDVEVRGLRVALKPGEKVRLIYRGKTDNNIYIDVDESFWVLDITQTIDAHGNSSASLVLLNIDKRPLDDRELIASAVKAIKSEKLVIKPTAFRQSYVYYDTVQHNGGVGGASNKDARFRLAIDDTVTEITRVIIEWRTTPLYTVSTFDDPLLDTAMAAPANPHAHGMTAHNLNGLMRVIVDDDFPTDVIVKLNGTDISNDGDVDYLTGGTGPWNNGGTPNAALHVKMDITDKILGDGGGIYQTFTIDVITNVGRTRDISIGAGVSFTVPINSAAGNHGIVEMTIVVEGICQAIYRN